MSDITINELYNKYINAIGEGLEDDRYFQYLFTMIDSGTNELLQQHQIMHKVVDEVWLTTVEECLDSLNKIIEKPRRFVTTNEEVVPVELAKKITGDSVRHLSMNTQFITSVDNGEVHPTRILNVSVEESYDLYENRFIYHLIQRLVAFIDKRTDLIFWSTGDETRNVLSLTSHVDDAYEQIDYKIEMVIKNKQDHLENDSDNMDLFMRIDRVRRLVMALYHSPFCDLMKGCSKVRSPIQRTNLMMKDPDYRNCYRLWQFLESYEDVGYSIETRATTLEYDEDYLFQLYTNVVTSYTVFKQMLEADGRKISETPARRRRHLKPRFVRSLQEELLDDHDLKDVEVRQVLINEITEAQLQAEERLGEETRLREEAEISLQKAEAAVLRAEEDADRARDAMEKMASELEQSQRSQAEAEALAKKESAARAEAERLMNEAREAEALAQHLKAEAEEQRRKAEEQRQAAEAARDAALEAERLAQEAEALAKKAEEEAIARAKKTEEEAQAQIRKTEEEAQTQIKKNEEEAAKRVEKAEAAQAAAREAQALAEAARADAESQKEDALAKAAQSDMDCEAALAREKKTKEETESYCRQMEADTEKLRGELEADTEKLQQQLKSDAEKLQQQLKSDTEKLQQQLKTDTEKLQKQLNAETDSLRAQHKQQLDQEAEELRRRLTAENDAYRQQAKKASEDAKAALLAKEQAKISEKKAKATADEQVRKTYEDAAARIEAAQTAQNESARKEAEAIEDARLAREEAAKALQQAKEAEAQTKAMEQRAKEDAAARAKAEEYAKGEEKLRLMIEERAGSDSILGYIRAVGKERIQRMHQRRKKD